MQNSITDKCDTVYLHVGTVESSQSCISHNFYEVIVCSGLKLNSSKYIMHLDKI